MRERRSIILLPNVRRQVSLAGGVGGSQKMGVKALGMLCCQHPLCLNAEPRHPPLESWNGQRLTARPCSHISFRGPMARGMSLALVLISERSRQAAAFGQNAEIVTRQHRPGAACFWNILFSGGRWQARGWENRNSFHAAPLEYFCCGKKRCGPALRSQ
jgi:hypothetical protein